MIRQIAKNIIIRALEIRKGNGEDIKEILRGYKNLTNEEKEEILNSVS